MTTVTPLPAADTIFGLSSTDVSAWATIALAVVAALALIASVIVSIGTWRMANATRSAAQAAARSAAATETAAAATKSEADATREEATATKGMVDEIRRDRELSYRPYVSWKLAEVTSMNSIVQDNPSPRVIGANFGRGPALHCLCVATWPDVMVLSLIHI